jgi:hypothetical protein
MYDQDIAYLTLLRIFRRLNPHGKLFDLSGKWNFVEKNAIDYRVGGVHLTSQNIWCHRDGTVIGVAGKG